MDQSASPVPRFTAFSDEELGEALHLGPASWTSEAWFALRGEAVRRGWAFTPPVPGVRGVRKLLTYEQRRWTTAVTGLFALLCVANGKLGWDFPSAEAATWLSVGTMLAFGLSFSILGPGPAEMGAVNDARRRARAAKPGRR